jgi:hypothetical protein
VKVYNHEYYLKKKMENLEKEEAASDDFDGDEFLRISREHPIENFVFFY